MLERVTPLGVARANGDVCAARWCAPRQAALQVEERIRITFGEVRDVGRSDAGHENWADVPQTWRLATVAQLRTSQLNEWRGNARLRERRARQIALRPRRRVRSLFWTSVASRAASNHEC